ncbi:1-O-acylceramide synthase [Entamoeba marina]
MFGVLLFLYASGACVDRKPVVLIPGVMSTVLNAELDIPNTVSTDYIPEECARKQEEFRIWENFTLLYKQPQCNFGYLKQQYNTDSGHLESLPGVNINVPSFGSVYACSKMDPSIPGTNTQYFQPLIRKLEKKGYRDQNDLFCAGYDWRISSLSGVEWIKSTIDLIKKISQSTNKKVVVVSHSYGGLMTKFLFDQFSDHTEYVDHWVSAGTPWKGSFLGIQSMLSGLDWVPVEGQIFADASRQIEANYQMLPHLLYWGKQDLLRVGDQTYNVDNLIDVLDHLTTFGSSLYKKLLIDYSTMPSIPMDCVYSDGIETAEYGDYVDWSFKNAQITYGNGDDAVNFESLSFCKDIGFNATYLGKNDHVGLVQSDDFADFLSPIICA